MRFLVRALCSALRERNRFLEDKSARAERYETLFLRNAGHIMLTVSDSQLSRIRTVQTRTGHNDPRLDSGIVFTSFDGSQSSNTILVTSSTF